MEIANQNPPVSLVGGQSIVIGVDGVVRQLKPGEAPKPGELIVARSESDQENLAPVEVSQISTEGELSNVTAEIDDIFSAIEQGVDPTAIDPELAPAAGGPEGSSLGLSGTVARDGTEIQPETVFVTEASSLLSLSTTQSLGLFSVLSSVGDNVPPSTVVPPTSPPTANDDPVGFTLTQGNMAGSELGWGGVKEISASFDGQGANPKYVINDRLGVDGTGIDGGPDNQIQYDRSSGKSENLSIKFDKSATEGRFAITNLFANEGEVSDDGQSNNEAGIWTAYLNGVVVASGYFEGVPGGEKQFVDIETNGNAFDEIVFSATEYSLGAQGDTSNDSSDYYLAGIEVSSPGHYATNSGIPLRISIDEILSNDSDPEGTELTIDQLVIDPSQGSAEIVGDEIIFTPAPGASGTMQIQYRVVDGDGETDTALISILVNEPIPTVDSVTNASATEGEDLVFTVTLDKETSVETLFNGAFSLLGDTSAEDINLDQVSYTNGVTMVSGGILLVPEGVTSFDVVLPTRIDMKQEDIEKLEFTIQSFDSSIGDAVTAEGSILDRTDVIDVGYELEQGDANGDGLVPKWDEGNLKAEVIESGQISLNHLTGKIGISGGPEDGGPIKQIQYDRDTDQSEKLIVKLDTPATSGSFAVSNLYANEGAGDNNHEVGRWIAKLNGEPVASGFFEGVANGESQTYHIYTQGYAFDEIEFSATEYSLGLNGGSGNDSSDYFVDGLFVEASHEFSVQKTVDENKPTELVISQQHIFSQLGVNSTDGYQLSAAKLTNLSSGDVNIDDKTGELVFVAKNGFIGNTNVEFEVIEPNGSIRYGVIEIEVTETLPEITTEYIVEEQAILSASDDIDLFSWVDQPSGNDRTHQVVDFEVGKDKLDLSDLFEDNITLDAMLAKVSADLSHDEASLEVTVETENTNQVKINLASDAASDFTAFTKETLFDDVLINLPD
ncbi:cadherin-like domain-containing protein [Vibrio fluminensis]|uniref:cadherin-like domain-containing protein n=1 Tax=Vibrio fluminensis TaxID=2783614 RepID=UPI00188989CE|nr:cadherin-like domain-containing protein [Vibrio fluminensis]